MADPTIKRIEIVARRANLGFHQAERVKVRNLRMKGRDAIRAKDLEAALPYAVEASELSGEVQDVQQLAIILSRLQRWKQAAPLWVALGKGANVPPRSLLLAGRALIRGGKLQAARGAFLRRLEANPDDQLTRNTLAKLDDRLATLSVRRKAKRAKTMMMRDLAGAYAGGARRKLADRPQVFRSLDAIIAARSTGEPRELDA